MGVSRDNLSQLSRTFSHSVNCFVLFPGVPRAPRGPFSESSQKVLRKFLEREGGRRREKVGEGWRGLEKVRENLKNCSLCECA